MLPSVGPTELIILLVIILLLFGAKRIPELAKGLGTGLREFRKGTSGENEDHSVEGRQEENQIEDKRDSGAAQGEAVTVDDDQKDHSKAGDDNTRPGHKS